MSLRTVKCKDTGACCFKFKLFSIPSLSRQQMILKNNFGHCLENPMDGGAWWATIHGIAKSQTRLSDFTFTFTLDIDQI